MKITKCEMRKVLGKIKERLEVIEEKNSEFEDIVKETIQTETQQEEELRTMNGTSVNCGAISRSQIHVQLKFLKEKRE